MRQTSLHTEHFFWPQGAGSPPNPGPPPDPWRNISRVALSEQRTPTALQECWFIVTVMKIICTVFPTLSMKHLFSLGKDKLDQGRPQWGQKSRKY